MRLLTRWRACTAEESHIPHPTYSHNLAICDFYLLGHIKERLAGGTVVDADSLRNEVMSILAEVSADEKVEHSSFG
jgi:hypothetical protein